MMKFFTTREVAETIRMTEDYVNRQCVNGAIRAKKLGNTWRISEDALVDFMTGGVAEPARVRDTLTPRQRRAVAQRRRSA